MLRCGQMVLAQALVCLHLGMWNLYFCMRFEVAQEELIFSTFLLKSCETVCYESILLMSMDTCSSIQ
jgi:hypothetical protein